jgi:hypothetical protein
MDDGPERWTEARDRKQKYALLLNAMKAAGWAVDEEVRVIMGLLALGTVRGNRHSIDCYRRPSSEATALTA